MKLLSAALVCLLVGGCGEPSEDASVRVVASLPPLAWPADVFPSDRVEVTVLLPPGASPHGFELSPSDIASLREADLILLASEIDAWVLRGLEVDDDRVIVMSEGHDHHPWLDLEKNYELFTYAVADRLAEEVGMSGGLKSYAGSYIGVADGLGEAIDRSSTAAQSRRVLVITGHDAWASFFESIGIEEVIPVRRSHAGEPAASVLAEVRTRSHGAEAVLVVFEPGETDPWLRDLAEEVGAATVTLDPVGTRDWLGDMRDRYDAVTAALESLE